MANEHAKQVQKQEQGNQRAMPLKEILGDQKRSALFGEMLQSQNRLDVAQRLRMKQSTQEDMNALTGKEGMGEFQERMKSAEKLVTMMTPQNLEKISQGKSEKMQTLVKAIGIEGIRGAIVPQIEMLAMRDPGRIKDMLKSFEFMATREKQQKDADTKFSGLSEKYGVSKDVYDEIVKDPNPAQRSLRLEQAIYSKMGRIPGLRRKTKEKNADQGD